METHWDQKWKQIYIYVDCSFNSLGRTYLHTCRQLGDAKIEAEKIKLKYFL